MLITTITNSAVVHRTLIPAPASCLEEYPSVVLLYACIWVLRRNIDVFRGGVVVVVVVLGPWLAKDVVRVRGVLATRDVRPSRSRDGLCTRRRWDAPRPFLSSTSPASVAPQGLKSPCSSSPGADALLTPAGVPLDICQHTSRMSRATHLFRTYASPDQTLLYIT